MEQDVEMMEGMDLYLAGENTFEDIFAFLHIPIDNYIMDMASDKFHIRRPDIPWSKWDYSTYREYQNALRSRITGEAPLRWEFHNWLQAARNYLPDK